MGVETAAVVGGGLLLKSGLDYYSGRQQQKAAESAAVQSQVAAAAAAAEQRRAEAGARGELQQGAAQGQRYLGQAYDLLGQGRSELEGIFGQEREVGSEALQRLRDVILGGDMSQLQLDPGYGFRLEQGNKAIERAARASGSFGGGRNLSDFARFGQGLASQEYGAAINRLMGLQDIGAQANRSYATLGQGYYQGQAGILGGQSNLASMLGAQLASLRTNTATNIGNLLTGGAANASNYQLQAANAQANTLGGIGDTALQAAALYALLGGGGGAKPPAEEFVL